jgi:hypothetical protein
MVDRIEITDLGIVSAELKILFSLFIYLYVHTFLGHFSPRPLPLPSLTHPLASRQNLFCPFLQFVEEKT